MPPKSRQNRANQIQTRQIFILFIRYYDATTRSIPHIFPTAEVEPLTMTFRFLSRPSQPGSVEFRTILSTCSNIRVIGSLSFSLANVINASEIETISSPFLMSHPKWRRKFLRNPIVSVFLIGFLVKNEVSITVVGK